MKTTISSLYQNNLTSPEARRIIVFTRILIVVWTVLLAASCWTSILEHNHTVEKIASAQARAAIGRDMLYRRWGAMHGGVYVPPTATTPPNPYLAHVQGRDVVTREGKQLTLINPAYMTRQVYEMAQNDSTGMGVGHLTSLKPLRPENAPDPWEIAALQAFASGEKEVSRIVEYNGKKYLRLMKPFVTEQSCLKCHGHQGYKIGDIRGGLNVSIPIQPLTEATQKEISGSIIRHGVVWLLGLLLFIPGSAKLTRSAQSQKLVEDELHLQATQMEEEIAERQAAQEALQEQAVLLEEEIVVRQQAQDALMIKSDQMEALNQNLETLVTETLADLRKKDQMMIQQGRLAAMGEMVNNIAHQWRQPLNNVGLLIQNLQLEFEAGKLTSQEMERGVDSAMKTIIHMSHTIDDFRNFFRQDKEKESFLVHSVVKRTLEFVGATLENQGISVKFDSAETVTSVGYKNEYAQVVLNILSNARDALVERHIENPEIRVLISAHDNTSRVSIADNGGGIDPDILPKIFDPYFTTKEPGKGTGIGLYMSKIIIEQNMGGKLTAHNVPGGVEFVIEL